MNKMGMAPHGALLKAEGSGGRRRSRSNKQFPLKDCEFRVQHHNGKCTVTANTAEPLLQLRKKIAEALHLEPCKKYAAKRLTSLPAFAFHCLHLVGFVMYGYRRSVASNHVRRTCFQFFLCAPTASLPKAPSGCSAEAAS